MAENCMKVRIADGADCKPALRVEVANMKGVWPALVAGAAQSLVGPKVSEGPAVALAAPATGAAIFDTIKGRTLVWNQLADSSKYAGGTSAGVTITKDGDYLVLNGTTSTDLYYRCFYTNIIPTTSGHKYLVLVPTVTSIYYYDDSAVKQFNNMTAPFIFTGSGVGLHPAILSYSGKTFTNAKISWNIIDLTAMFGAGNEPATAAEFEAIYGELYYAYNTGTLLPYKGTGLKGTGVNQWDEQWESGIINSSTGQNSPSTNQIRSKNYIPVIPGKQYYGYLGNTSSQYDMYLFYYDENKNYRSDYYASCNRRTVTIPSWARYIRICTQNTTYGTTYKHDICINISDTAINGQYFPYVENTLSLPVVGKTAKDGNGNPIVPFPAGMHGTPTEYDTATKEGGEVKWGVRAYEAGDESDATVITDGTNTAYPLATPIPFTWDEPLEMVAPVEAGGVLLLQPEGVDEQGIPATAPLAADIKWPFSVSSIDGTLTNLLDALKTAGVISAYTMAYNAATGKYDFTIN